MAKQSEITVIVKHSEALAYAIGIIRSYQADIRERGLDQEGFCQGAIYLEAEDVIKRIQLRENGLEDGSC